MDRLVKVVILDRRAIAESLAIALSAEPRIESAHAVTSLSELASRVDSAAPDVVLADIDLGNAIERLRVCDLEPIRTGRIPVVYMSRDNYPSLRETVQQRGAAGYLLKHTSLDTIARALCTVRDGGTAYFDVPGTPYHRKSYLPSDREIELMNVLSLGMTNDSIAHEMAISKRTVESHLHRLFTRYGVSSRAQLVLLAIREGWVATG